MLILTEAQVAELLNASDALAAVESAFRAQAEQRAQLPMRRAVHIPKGLLGSMPGAILDGQPSLGAKLVTFFPGNAELQKHTHQALIALFDTETGAPIAMMDGRFITEIRTAAASAAATRALAGETRKTLAILGAGVQARAHIQSHARIMRLADIRL
ncbi:MAG: ornithine cyclodeaminase family protein, partial [Candidatus Eremiobacteraeota bacterium]|nr:ornithine cyclodeaminase family protein [Candidatus Eremiobacteraeota bacterium]